MSDATSTQQQQWTAEAILEFLHAHRDTLRQMGVQQIGLFGSHARGEQHPDSDIDLLVTMEDASYRKYMNVWNFLEDHFGQKVDLGEPHLLRDEIRSQVMKDVRYVAGLSPVSE
jgi:uncharacterized protein